LKENKLYCELVPDSGSDVEEFIYLVKI